jgi:hypothetical protein
MSFKFNPLTGDLDLIGDAISVVFKKSHTVVDNAFLIPRTITLDAEPLLDSEQVFYNGLLLEDSCYLILINELTFDALLNIKIGDIIDVRYVI